MKSNTASGHVRGEPRGGYGLNVHSLGAIGETATTSKEGSRRANYPILTQGGSDNK